MKQEKYEKAMTIHYEKLHAYSNELHELVGSMRDDGLTWHDVVGLLETEKLYRFNESFTQATSASVLDMLDELADMFSEEE